MKKNPVTRYTIGKPAPLLAVCVTMPPVTPCYTLLHRATPCDPAFCAVARFITQDHCIAMKSALQLDITGKRPNNTRRADVVTPRHCLRFCFFANDYRFIVAIITIKYYAIRLRRLSPQRFRGFALWPQKSHLPQLLSLVSSSALLCCGKRDRPKRPQIWHAVSLLAAQTENAKYREILAKTRAAMDRAAQALESAGRDHAERVAQIDRADSNWLVCPLPDDVRNAFTDDPYGMDPASEVSPDVLRYSAGK